MILSVEANLIIITAAIILSVIIISGVCFLVFRNPYHYPYQIKKIDISGRRNPQIEDLIDQCLIEGYFPIFSRENESIQKWKDNAFETTEHGLLKNYRLNQFLKVLDDDHAFVFQLIRSQTRYKQRNYVKTSYQVYQTVSEFRCSFDYLKERNDDLSRINYECTLNEYHSRSQRRLMTKELRRMIMERDNYTCQCCGKYMPDEVGLHIDHILPVSKGGKSIPTNLQVLCSKCNGKKSNAL